MKVTSQIFSSTLFDADILTSEDEAEVVLSHSSEYTAKPVMAGAGASGRQLTQKD